MKPETDSQLGTIKETFSIYSCGFDICGQIKLCESGLIVTYKDATYKTPFDFVQSLESVGKSSLARVKARMGVFDQINGNTQLEFEIADIYFKKLKQVCKK